MALCRRHHHLGYVDGFVLHAEILALELVEAPQRAQETAETLDLLADDTQVLGRRRQDAVLERLHPGLDRGQRRAQFV
jgi:hypothetical protein